MAFTLSGVWTGVIISLLALSILYIVTNIKGIFLLVYPGVMIWILLLSMLRMFFSAEFAFAQGIFLKNIFPPLDFLLRFPLLKGIRIYHILITFWGVGALRKIQSLVLDYSSMYKLLLACPGLEKEQLCIAKNAEKDTGISRHNIQYKTSAQYDVPLLFGIFRSTILIPEKYRSLSNEELYFVFGHELSHQKKHDCIMRLGIHIICCIFWWIPFLDKLVSHIEEAMEIRADWNMTKNMSVSQKKEYLSMLYKAAEWECSEKTSATASLFINKRTGFLQERFRFILNQQHWKWTRTIIVLSFLLFLMSYSIILEPHYEPKESGAYICEETCSIYEQNDGTYKLFMDGQYIGVLDNLKFLNDETFKDLTIEFHSYNDK